VAEPTTTRKLIRQKVIKKLYAGKYPIVGTTTGTSLDNVSIIDSMFAPSAQSEDYNSAFIYISESESGSPAVGEVARVTDIDFTGTNSKLIFAPAFTDSVNSGMDYEMHYNFHPTEINDRINELLENIRGWVFIPLDGLLTNGNMGDATITTNWTASSATFAVATTSDAAGTFEVLFGDSSMKITAGTAGTDYVGQSVFISANTPLLASVYAFVDSSNGGSVAEMEIWDVTNGAQIGESCNTTTFNQWVQLTTQITVPATCKQIQMRLFATGSATSTVYYDAATILERDQRTHDLPSAFDGPEDMQLVEYFPRGDKITVGTSLNAYRVLQYPAEKWSDFEILRDPRGATPTRIMLIQNRRDRVGSYYTSSRATPSWSSRSRVGNDIDHPLFFRGRVDYPTVSGATELLKDATVVYAPEDYIVNLLFADLIEEMALQDLDEEKHDAYNTKMAKALDIRQKIDFLARTNSDDRVTVRGTFNAQ